MAGAAVAEGKVWPQNEKHLCSAWTRSGIARFDDAMAVRSGPRCDSKRQNALSVPFALGRVGALSGRLRERKDSRQRWLDRRRTGRCVFLWPGRGTPARERRRGRFPLLRDRG